MMSIDQRDQDVVFTRTRDKTEKLERRDPFSSISTDEKTIPDGGSERQLTTAEVIRAMSATFRHKRA